MRTRAHMELLKMDYNLLKSITDDFSEKRVLGAGAFGTVYKGVLSNGKEVAVKVVRVSSVDEENYLKEVSNLATLNHANIVKLVGYCNESELVPLQFDGKLVMAHSIHQAICLEYMHNGSLQKHISDANQGLSWHVRYKIIKGICAGLNYLHEGLESPILHLDLKPENILLDINMEPKIADFYLSRLINEEGEARTQTTIGTLGYMPPEFIKHQIFSGKFDIFSLGVIIIKIIVGPRGYHVLGDMTEGEFVKHVLNIWRVSLQATLKANILEACCQQVERCLEIAMQCIRPKPNERPTTKQIITLLNQTETEQDNYGRKVRRYSYDELKKITNKFHRERCLGSGGFGAVFKGVLEDGELIAVKRLNDDALFQERQFESEGTLKRLDHRNIVRLLGYCDEEVPVAVRNPHTQEHEYREVTERLLCYEYMPKGSLDTVLFGIRKQDEPHGLDWEKRYKIIEGMCQGLYYLHEGCPDAPIVHRDLKPANILLDNEMVPKLGDFGLSRIFPKEVSHLKTVQKAGTTGYMAPEYANGGIITTKSDIFSLGIVIMEITTEERCGITGLSDRTFSEWIQRTCRMVDSRITSMYQSLEPVLIKNIKSLVKMAQRCANEKPGDRPTIGQIIRFLDDKFNNFESNKNSCRDKVRKMSFELLTDITNNFSKERLLVHNNFYVVYKGVSLDGEVFAVKIFNKGTGQSEQHLMNEMNIARFEHTNIAKLVGYCNERTEARHNCENTADDVYQEPAKLLCYEFSSNGSLHQLLYESSYKLDWQTRYKIIEGICKALHYLHEKCEHAPVVHMDLKPANIMLDNFMVPKLTNFGLSKLLGQGYAHITATTVVGSMGHMAPEYIMYGEITTATDIYSLGILIIEILTGENCPRVDDARKRWMKRSYIASKFPSIEPGSRWHLERFIRIALVCVVQEPAKRPTAGKIVDMLQRDPDSSEDISEGRVRMSYEDLKDATNNFSEELRRSEFGISALYKGMLHDGEVVAVKRFIVQDVISQRQHNSELYLLRFEHKNIVQLKGYCDETIEVIVFSTKQQKYIYEEISERLLCYEFYPNGGLDKIIYGKSDHHVWQTRFNIIKGVCQGLLYLHEESEEGTIVHMDIKPENILLNGDLIPKIASFGLAKLIPKEHSHIFDDTVKNASRGCMAPDYISTHKITTKLDIYCFGILIMEIVTGEKCIITNNDRSCRSFINNVQKSWMSDRYVTSKYLSLEIDLVHQMKQCIEIGMRCVDISPDERPTAREIITMLESECTESREPTVKLRTRGSSCFGICCSS